MNINNLRYDTLEKLYEVVEPMQVDIFSMPVGEVLQCIFSSESLCNYADEKYKTVIDKLSFIKGFIDKSNTVFSVLNKFNNDVSPEYNQAVLELGNQPSITETMLTDCVGWYHLHSTAEAEQLPFSDWFLMKKREAYNGSVERRTQAIINRKHEQQLKSKNIR